MNCCFEKFLVQAINTKKRILKMQYGPDGVPVSNVSILVGPPLRAPGPVPVTTTTTVIGPLIYDTADAQKPPGGNVVPDIAYAVAVADEGTEVVARVSLINFEGSSVNVVNDGGGGVTVEISDNAGITVAAGAGISIATVGSVSTVTNTFTETVYNGGNWTGTVTPNRNNGTIQKYTLTGNITLNAPTNMSAGQSLTLILTQDSPGNRDLTASASYLFAGGFNTLSNGAGEIDMLNIFYDGSVYYVTLTVGYTNA
jgi:hypothetical protein